MHMFHVQFGKAPEGMPKLQLASCLIYAPKLASAVN